MGAPDSHPLDNVAWHSYGSAHRHLATESANGSARRLDPDVSPFAACSGFEQQDWDGLADLFGPDEPVVLFRQHVPEPPRGWKVLARFPASQMVAGTVAGPDPTVAIVDLWPDDYPTMIDLAERTEPGPFGARTALMGDFVGICSGDGRLLAMAGQRFRTDDWIEISAVATEPDTRGKGLGAAVTAAMVQRIHDGGAEAFLHVLDTNTGARRLYEHMGFIVRCPVEAVALGVPRSDF